MATNLILRTSTSPYGDTNKGSVLSQSELDSNFIFLKGEVIYTAITSGNNVTLKKYNGNDIIFPSGGGGGIGNQWYIPSGDTVTIPTNFQSFIYGDLFVYGDLYLDTDSQLVVLNGNVYIAGTITGPGTIYVIDLPTFDTFITGGTYDSGTGSITFGNNSGGTFSVTGITSSSSIDVFVTGGTYDNGTGIISFTNNTGGTFTVTGITSSGSGNTGTLHEITYNDFMTLLNSNSLTPLQHYLITDFQTVHYIQFSGDGLGSEEINHGDIEPMIVEALSSNTVSNFIYSLSHPEDIITWIPDFGDRDWDAVLGQSTGVITSREDTLLKLKRDFDWRNVIFRRWESITGTGVYDSYFNPGTGSTYQYQDYPPFAISGDGSYNCYIGSPLIASAGFGFPYWLDNTIGKQSTSFMSIDLAFANNIEGDFDGNNRIRLCLGNKVSTDFIYNNIDIYVNNDVYLIDSNKGTSLNNNNGNGGNLTIKTNSVSGSIVDNSFDGEIHRNFVVGIQNNVSNQTSCLMRENTGIEINNNVDFQTIENNIINFITDTNFNGKTLKDSSGSSFRNNNFDQDIFNNNFIASIYGKTFTPTAGMQSTNPSVTLWDSTNGDVEQVLSGGVLTYIVF